MRTGQRFRGTRRTEPTPEEKQRIGNARQIRKLGKRLSDIQFRLRAMIDHCFLAQSKGWPMHPERWEPVLDLTWQVFEVRAEARNL